jgi:hypothetical protein
MASVRSATDACVAGKTGMSQVTARVVDSGKITHVVVHGDFAGTSEGSCIARVVRTAALPPFSREQFEFTYPFAF